MLEYAVVIFFVRKPELSPVVQTEIDRTGRV